MALQSQLSNIQNASEDFNKEIQSMISSIHQVSTPENTLTKKIIIIIIINLLI